MGYPCTCRVGDQMPHNSRIEDLLYIIELSRPSKPLMQLQQTPKDSSDPSIKMGQKMKISLFIKPITVKACFSLVVFMYVFAQSSPAYAGFFSDLVRSVMGNETQASEVETIKGEVIHNSQNVPLLESSINPDLKNIKRDEVVILEEEGLLSTNGALDVDSELEKYDPTVKITTYVVQKGDTIEGIAKKLGITKAAIIDSNADLKEDDMIKVGESLVILGLKAEKAKELANKEDVKVATPTKKEEPKKKEEVKIAKVAPEPKKEAQKTEVKKEVIAQVQAPVVNTPVVEVQASKKVELKSEEAPTPTGQPDGDIDGGYIWPFPKGVGRVSQGLHADQAYDFAAPKGTPIYAVNSGTVVVAKPTGYNGGYGLYVVINFDDGRQAIFGHMSKVQAKAGQVVKKGEVIGYVGTTGKSTGNHLHLGFRGALRNPYIGLKVNDKDFINHE